MDKLISKRYAVALFKLAQESDKMDKFYQEVSLIINSIKDNEDFLPVINHPSLSSKSKFDIFEKAFKGSISEEIFGLISLIFQKNREAELFSIFQTFLALVDEFNGVVTATIFSAIKLSDSQLENIKNNLAKQLNKKVIIEEKQDPTIIGGLIINVDGKIIDNSIKKSLSDIKKALLINK